METLRIINNNLPFRSVEYEESILLRELVYKDAMAVTLNAKLITHTIVELYSSTKRAVIDTINAARVNGHGKFAIVVDFWSSKPQTTKYLGIRLYMVDTGFQFKSVLLSTRHFDPQYGDRDQGLRFPFRRWIVDVLDDFGLKTSDLFGGDQ